ncbi:hypothetical protein EXN66_Car002801 [Channa argus]|uniref:Uncharacterized protein n=1 Tax=Channa argus TaxID=215402 RepID=A0A6G1PA90_CHAAH|nr:hypothetical protein EXN66_Car002801 [Channa argus]
MESTRELDLYYGAFKVLDETGISSDQNEKLGNKHQEISQSTSFCFTSDSSNIFSGCSLLSFTGFK